MANTSYRFEVKAEGPDVAGRGAVSLADMLRDVAGVLEVTPKKADDQTMDLGTIVTAIATSGSLHAIALGLAAWLRARRRMTLTIERKSKDESLKVAVTGVDPEAGVRIIELVLDEKQ
jgi:hypothetical protein